LNVVHFVAVKRVRADWKSSPAVYCSFSITFVSPIKPARLCIMGVRYKETLTPSAPRPSPRGLKCNAELRLRHPSSAEMSPAILAVIIGASYCSMQLAFGYIEPVASSKAWSCAVDLQSTIPPYTSPIVMLSANWTRIGIQKSAYLLHASFRPINHS